MERPTTASLLIEFVTTNGRVAVAYAHITGLSQAAATQTRIHLASADPPFVVQESYASVLGRLEQALAGKPAPKPPEPGEESSP